MSFPNFGTHKIWRILSLGDFVMGAFVTGNFVMGDFVVDSHGESGFCTLFTSAELVIKCILLVTTLN